MKNQTSDNNVEVYYLTSHKVTSELHISLRQLYYWELKGVIKPETRKLGSREFKRYSMKQLEVLRKVRDYLDDGYTLNSALQRVKTESGHTEGPQEDGHSPVDCYQD